MTFPAAALCTCAATIVLGYAATQPEELRQFRWLKIGLSMPPVLVITSAVIQLGAINAYFSAFSFAILAFIWRSPIAHAGSLVFMRLIQGDVNRVTSGVRAEFGAAKALRKHGDLDDALRQTKAEHEKEPYNYEGLILLAQIYLDLEDIEAARRSLDLVLRRSVLTPEQRTAVRSSYEALVEG